MNKYKPNFNDPRVFNRVTKATEWALEHFDDKPREFSTREINKHLGRTNDNLGRYLRFQLLIETNSNYCNQTGKCKEFKLNRLGIDSLRSSIHCSVNWRLLRNTASCSNEKKENTFIYCTTSLPQREIQEENRYNRNKNRFEHELVSKQFKYKYNPSENPANQRMHHGLQNMMNQYGTRDRLFYDYGFVYKYDIDNCMQALFLSLYYQITNKPLTAIESYIKNKKQWRKRLAKQLEIEEPIAKQIITATFTGALVAHNKYSSINKILENDKAKIIWLEENIWYQKLKQDVKKMWRTIKRTQPNTRLTARNKWCVYQSLEHKVAREIIFYLNTHNVKYFWLHDGWYADKQIDTTNLEQLIKQQTALHIKLTEEKNK